MTKRELIAAIMQISNIGARLQEAARNTQSVQRSGDETENVCILQPAGIQNAGQMLEGVASALMTLFDDEAHLIIPQSKEGKPPTTKLDLLVQDDEED